MTKKEEILNLIYDSMDQIIDMIDNSENFQKKPTTALYGKDSALDSMATVGLVIALEEKVNQVFNKSLTLANEKAVSLKNSPFRTVDSLADYIIELLK